MHELYVTKNIHEIVLKHATKGNVNQVLSVNLEIGTLSDLQSEWMQRYFDKLNRGTVLEGAKLNITRVPAIFRCNHCQHSFEIYSLVKEDLTCKQCISKEVSLVSGREYRIKNMEAQ